MKKKEKQTLQGMKKEELVKVLADARNALVILKTGKFAKQIKNVREGKPLRQKIAVIKTLIRQKELTHE